MPRFIVKDRGIFEPLRYHVIDTDKEGDDALVLPTSNRTVADGLAADHNYRFAPSLFVRIARLFGYCMPKPVEVAPTKPEQAWQTKIRILSERIEAKKRRVA